jgi:hypothetical protein
MRNPGQAGIDDIGIALRLLVRFLVTAEVVLKRASNEPKRLTRATNAPHRVPQKDPFVHGFEPGIKTPKSVVTIWK